MRSQSSFELIHGKPALFRPRRDEKSGRLREASPWTCLSLSHSLTHSQTHSLYFTMQENNVPKNLPFLLYSQLKRPPSIKCKGKKQPIKSKVKCQVISQNVNKVTPVTECEKRGLLVWIIKPEISLYYILVGAGRNCGLRLRMQRWALSLLLYIWI